MKNHVNKLLMSIPLYSLMLGTVLAAAAVAAGQSLITFESVPGVTAKSNYFDASFAADTARFNTQLQMSDGVSFSSPAGYVVLVNLGVGHATSGNNGFGGATVNHILKYDQPVVITFSMPGSPTIPAVTDFVSIRGDRNPASGLAKMEAFDDTGALIGSTTAADIGGGLTLTLGIPNMHSIRLTQTLSNIAYDDLRFNQLRPAVSDRPIASAGIDRHIHSGETVILDGSGSSDDNTGTDSLVFTWIFISRPDGSAATLADANTVSPQFVADLPGEYIARLVVTDGDGQVSDPDTLSISSLNSSPTADAGADQGAVVGQTVMLDALASSDPDLDPLTYSWTLTAPNGTNPGLFGETTAFPTFTPAVAGTYTATVTVSDPFGGVSIDNVTVAVISSGEYAADQIAAAINIVGALTSEQVTTKGNRQALQRLLTQALAALRDGDIDEAVSKLTQASERTDGCVLRGSPDGNGSGRDWILDCPSQAAIHEKLTAALNALTL